MTAILTPPESVTPTENPYRTVSVAADLLPPEIVESRRARLMRRIVVAALAVFVVFLAGWYGLARYQTAQARDAFNSAESDVQRLEGQQKAFAKLIGIKDQSQTIRTELATLLASDLQWSGILDAIEGAAPDGVKITSIAGMLNHADSGTSSRSSGAQLPNTTGKKVIGSLTVSGTANSKAVVADFVNKLMTNPRLGNAFISASTPGADGEEFTVHLDITAAALGGRFTTTSDKQAGGK